MFLLIFVLTVFFLPSWCLKIPSFIIPVCLRNFFCHSFRVNLLVTNFLSFPSSEDLLLSLSFLKDIFIGCKTLVCQLFIYLFFSLQITCHVLWLLWLLMRNLWLFELPSPFRRGSSFSLDSFKKFLCFSLNKFFFS